MKFSTGLSPSVIGVVGRERDTPEISDTIPYDPFKVDLFALRSVYSKEFVQSSTVACLLYLCYLTVVRHASCFVIPAIALQAGGSAAPDAPPQAADAAAHRTDGVPAKYASLIDARRTGHGDFVYIKTVRRQSRKASIISRLSSLRHLGSHCVPVIEIFDDHLHSKYSLLAMPFVRPFNSPPFVHFREVMDFVAQMLEGLAFVYGQQIVHQLIAPSNIQMDGRPLYPNGPHPLFMDQPEDLRGNQTGTYTAVPQ
ncbi:hypothetical protein C8Q77DRAFT_298337 [Trametes polyzona]|nr:hypothetical protein C8Q77DRAFT_298337 [Trametes polyzona]